MSLWGQIGGLRSKAAAAGVTPGDASAEAMGPQGHCRDLGPTRENGYGFSVYRYFPAMVVMYATKITKWIFWILILECERTQQPRDLSCCRLPFIDAKSRPHHRAKYGRGGSGISRVMPLAGKLAVSRFGFFGLRFRVKRGVV